MARSRRVRESGGGGKFGAFLLGTFMGVVVVVGALAGAGYYVYTSPIKDTVELIDGEQNGSLYKTLFGDGTNAGFLNPDYANKKVGDLISDTQTAVSALSGEGSLSDLDALSPKVRDTIKLVLETTDTYDIPLDEETLMSTPFNQLKDYALGQIEYASLGGLLKGFNGGKETEDPLMLAICYGTEGVDYKFDGDGNVVMLGESQKTTLDQLVTGGIEDRFSHITLDCLDIDLTDPLMLAIAYGTEGENYTFDEGGNVVMLGDSKKTTLDQLVNGGLDEQFKHITLDCLGFDVSDPLMRALCYGTEHVDYEIDGAGNIVMLGDSKKTTIDQLTNGGLDEQFKHITLDCLDIDVTDPIMRTLAYGPSSHYTMDGAGNITMKPIVFTRDGGKVYDIDGKEVTCTFDEDALTIELENGTVYYLEIASTSGTATTYNAYYNEQKTKRALYPKTTVAELTENSSTLIDDLYLGDALNVNNTDHQVLITLAYGSPDNYTVEQDGTIVPKPGYTPRTIGELKAEGNDIINGIYLKDALNITETSPKVLIAIAYGTQGKDYQYDANGKIEMLPGKTPKTLGDLSGEAGEELINGITIADALGVTASSHKVLISIAYGNEGENYDIVDGVITPRDGEANQPRTLASFSGTAGEALINNIRLADALGVTTSSHKVLIAIAYGNEGENYDIVDGVIIPRDGEGNKPRTLSSLSGAAGEALINNIRLADALNITPNSNKVLITLAYGKEGVDYEINGDKIEPLNGSTPRTLSDLNNNISTILNDIALADVMDPDPNSSIIMYLLYGREDIHYAVLDDGTVTPLQQRVAIYDGNVYNPYGEIIATTTDDTTFTLNGKVYVCESLPAGDKNPTLTLTIGETKVEAPYYLVTENGNPVFYQSATIGDLSGENNAITLLTKRLTLGEILGKDAVDNNIFLQHVQNETIDSLPAAIENLTFADVYANDIFQRKMGEDGKYYFIDHNGKNVDVDGDGELSEEEKKNRIVTSTWWYLLHSETECQETHCPAGEDCLNKDDDPNTKCTEIRTCQFNSCAQEASVCHFDHCHLGENCPYRTGGVCTEIPDCARKSCIHDYKITEFDALTANMTANVQTATLLNLQLDGIVSLDDDTLRTKLISELGMDVNGDGDYDDYDDYGEIKVEIEGVPLRTSGINKQYLQEMTIAEILNYAGNVLTAIDEFETKLNSHSF